MDIAIIGAPVDLGADRRGVDMGASAIRYTGLEPALRSMGHRTQDLGNIEVAVAESSDSGTTTMKYLDAIIDMSERLARRVDDVIREHSFPLILGGDHSLTLGSLAGVTKNRRAAVIWMDAHGDFNTSETSPSGNVHGMVLAALAGYGDPRLVKLYGHGPKVDPGNIALIGVRDIDAGERRLLLESRAHVFTMHDVDRLGVAGVVDLAVKRVSDGVDSIHLSLDLDVVDPLQAPGVGTPVPGGLNFRETHLAMEILAETGRLSSMDVVEVNPILDSYNETAKLATQFVLSALGKRIL